MTSVGFGNAEPLAGFRNLFDRSSGLLSNPSFLLGCSRDPCSPILCRHAPGMAYSDAPRTGCARIFTMFTVTKG